MINVVQKTSQKGTVYCDITSITPVMAGMEAQVPQPSNFDTSLLASVTPQTTTQVTVEQPQAVAPAPAQPTPVAQPQQAQMFSAPAPAPF